jgi:general secretion pathway protein K
MPRVGHQPAEVHVDMSALPRTFVSTRGRQRGIALVLVLWMTVLLTVIATTFAFDMRTEALAARNAVGIAQARALADGAVERFAFEMVRPRLRPEDAWKADGKSHSWTDGDARIVAWAVDEAARIDLNAAPDGMLKSLLVSVGQVDEATAVALVDAIADFRDPDDLRRPNGAEAADYRAANSKYLPANAPFESVADLSRVLGMTPEVFARIAPSLTVHSRASGINVFTAPRSVLLAIPNVTPEQVDDYLRQRQTALDNNQLLPLFPFAQGFQSGASAASRIHAEVVLPDGVTFVRESVVRPSGDVRRPLVVLAWTEGQPASAVAPAPAAGGAPIPNVPDAPRS